MSSSPLWTCKNFEYLQHPDSLTMSSKSSSQTVRASTPTSVKAYPSFPAVTDRKRQRAALDDDDDSKNDHAPAKRLASTSEVKKWCEQGTQLLQDLNQQIHRESELAALRKTTATLRQEVDERDDTIENLREQSLQSDEMLAAKGLECSILENQNRRQQRQIDELTEANAAFRTALARATARLHSIVDDNRGFMELLNEYVVSYDELSEELA